MPDSVNNTFKFISEAPAQCKSPVLVAMSTYEADKPEWVHDAIKSVCEQSYADFTFLIIVDGSVPAATTAMLLAFAQRDSRIIVAQNSHNIGLAASMNLAIEWAVTQLGIDYFFRMDADDACLPERLEKQVAFLDGHSEVDILGTGLTEVNESGDPVGARVMPASHHIIVRMLPRRCTVNHPTVAIRMKVFHDGFRYDAKRLNTQDYFLWIDLAAQGYQFRNLREKLLRFRRVNDFYKRRGLTKSLNEFKARFIAMRKLHRYSVLNTFYALAVLGLRLMPARVVKWAYKFDRILLEKIVKH
ncbi:glycosyltransferase [Salinimonas iocasae]